MTNKHNKDFNDYKVGSIVSYNIAERGDSFFEPRPIYTTSKVISMTEYFPKDRMGVNISLVMENGDINIIKR